MSYKIVFYKDDQVLGRTPWSGDLESAKKHAMDHFLSIHKPESGATTVVVMDDRNEKVVFSYPGVADA